ncbi:uncharacterized protein Nmag_3618 (plasmid) [Natrialba magadii ATCC 43099]|uniref:Uncharacterized protein n=1 Tax=Natrialba magadii (strain ATCC 43099 / DSM 3394 / CCM 3739 / CIP 104546 / IAM 13178 / JCM 8861 / NBRC 102185 / NCIMB 2190 / MS3) TaxID=547559 RepID=D3T0Q9_NATMM|nr:hypothetical protein [Natrialba magadii]ADD07168.1 uncharacterized protein Nmag_3618 [Natrialba magadii ATCC 43099]ELY34575.1 hypothetical protein C500_00067 [Natrialba magadii ATCC 43099]
MHAHEEIRDRLTALRRTRESCDYYDPRTKLIDGKIDALEWVLAETESAELAESVEPAEPVESAEPAASEKDNDAGGDGEGWY